MAHKKIDLNQREIVGALRSHPGVSCFSIASIGKGIPDLVVGAFGKTFLCEIKGPQGKLRPSQVEFQKSWRGGGIIVLRSIDEVEAFFKQVSRWSVEGGA